MKKNLSRFIIILLCLCIYSQLVRAQLRNTYRFYNTLSTTEPSCAQDLVPTRGLNVQCQSSTAASSGRFLADTLTSGISRVVYHNNLNWGLKYLNTDGIIGSTYTVQIYLKVTNFNRYYTRVIDFSNGVQDNGIYFTNYNTPAPTRNRCLNFYPNGNFGICPFFNDTTYYLLTITRNNATRKIDIYVNDQLFTSYNDLSNFYISTANKPVHIFRDDPVGFACEDGEANFAYLSFADYYSTQADVSQIYSSIDSISNTADFLVTPVPACAGSNVTVTYNGNIPTNNSGYIFNWNWDGGTVVSGSGRGPYSINWNTAGNKNITLDITGGGCATTISNNKIVAVSIAAGSRKDTTICNGTSYQGHTASGTYTTAIATTTGCDSIVTLNLTVLPPATVIVDTTICFGGSFEGHASSGTYVQTLSSFTGCDSTRTVKLTIRSAAVSSVDTTVCFGSSFEGHLTSGTYIQHITNAAGCDSTRTTRLTILPANNVVVDTSICNGAAFEGHSASGTYVQRLVGYNECDSTRTVRLTVLPVINTIIDTSVCNGALFEGYAASGTYVQRLTSFKGCDSTRTVRLTVLPAIATIVDTTICNGTSYNGQTTSGTYVQRLTGFKGCDSTVTTRLIVLPPAVSLIDTTICAGQVFEGFTAPGNYTLHLSSSRGCDSTRTIQLHQSLLIVTHTDTTLCAGGNFMGIDYTTIFEQQLKNAAGCDSFSYTHITVLPPAASFIDTTICAGASFEGYATNGTFTRHFTNYRGCDSTRTVSMTLTATALTPNLGTRTSFCSGDSIVLSPGNFDHYLWQDGSTRKTFTVKQGGFYSVVVSDNCSSTRADIQIAETGCSAFFPSAFSPANPTRNNIFRISPGNVFYQYHLVIYNRYGEKVFESTAADKGWNGKIKGVNASPGAYVWYCEYRKSSAHPQLVQKGTVLLLR